jgi:hypothetical protein
MFVSQVLLAHFSLEFCDWMIVFISLFGVLIGRPLDDFVLDLLKIVCKKRFASDFETRTYYFWRAICSMMFHPSPITGGEVPFIFPPIFKRVEEGKQFRYLPCSRIQFHHNLLESVLELYGGLAPFTPPIAAFGQYLMLISQRRKISPQLNQLLEVHFPAQWRENMEKGRGIAPHFLGRLQRFLGRSRLNGANSRSSFTLEESSLAFAEMVKQRNSLRNEQ